MRKLRYNSTTSFLLYYPMAQLKSSFSIANVVNRLQMLTRNILALQLTVLSFSSTKYSVKVLEVHLQVQEEKGNKRKEYFKYTLNYNLSFICTHKILA